MSYTDLTSSFAYKKPLPFTKLDALALNDAYDTFRSTTKTVFYQSSLPAGWTKQTGINDSAMRVVSGATGGTYHVGDQALSATITMAHTHANAGHSHQGNEHLHNLAMGSSANVPNTAKPVKVLTGKLVVMQADMFGYTRPAIVQNQTKLYTPSTSDVSVGTTNSQLSDIAFAYADVIVASKDS